jgi:outer membrane protein
VLFRSRLDGFAREDNAATDFTSAPGDALVFPGGIRRTNNYFAEGRLTVQQHLLKDFWIDADRERLLVRQKERSMSRQALRFEMMKILLAVELSYYDLIAGREQVRVQEKALDLREQFVGETRRRVQVGDLPPLDADQAETQLENTRTALLTAREGYALQQNSLKGLLTDRFGDWVNLEIEPTDVLLPIPSEVDRSKSFVNAMLHRPDLNEARLAVERSDVTVKFRFNQLFPSLDLVGRYGGLGVDPDPGTAVNHALSFGNPEYFYGVVVSLPLSNFAERGDSHASQAVKRIAQLQLRKVEQEILLQIANLVHRVESRFSQNGSTHNARLYAEAALAAELKKLQNGLSTSFVVLQLQETLTIARTAEILALADYHKALAQLAFADGSLLEKHHVVLDQK